MRLMKSSCGRNPARKSGKLAFRRLGCFEDEPVMLPILAALLGTFVAMLLEKRA